MLNRSLIMLSVAALLLPMSGCAASRSGTAWTPKESHPALARGVTTRGSYSPMICPMAPDWYVVRRDGSFVETFDELQAVLRPIDTTERALAYRDLLGDIQLERSEALSALQATMPLEFHDGERPFFGVYTRADAERWNVGTEPVIETVGETIVVTQPSFRYVDTITADGAQWHLGEGVVELVRETFYKDGRYDREIVRELESGESARVHQPAPLL